MIAEGHHLGIDVLVRGDAARLFLRGDIDLASAPHLISVVQNLRSQVHGIEVDCRHVDFLDSAGIRALIVSRNEARDAGIEFSVVDPSRSVVRILEMTGLSSLLTA